MGVHEAPAAAAPSATRWESRSHGEEAARLQHAREATELARLASSTALLLGVLSRQGSFSEELADLAANAEGLAWLLRTISAGTRRNETELPYRQLVPVQVWRDATGDDEELRSLADSLPALIEALLAGETDRGEAEVLIPKLHMLAHRMHDRGDKLLTG